MTGTEETARRRTGQLLMALVGAAAFFASAPGQSFLIAVFVDEMLRGTGLDRTTYSGLYAAGTVVSAVVMLVLGKVIDRRGVRIAWAVVTVGLALSCGLASVATGAVVVFVALAMLRTFGQGSFPLLGTLLVAQSFERRRGQAMAVANLGVTSASVLLPPVVAALIVAVGWRHAFQVLAVALLVVVLPLALLVRDRRARPRPARATDATEDYPPATRPVFGGRFTLPTRPAALMLLALAAPPLVGTALTFHAVSILAERGLDLLQAGFALSTIGVTAAVGTVAAGLLADRLGNRALLTLLGLTTLAAPVILLAPHVTAAYAAFGVLGLGLGSVGVINGTVWARTYGTAGLGAIQGTAQSSMITAAAVAPLIPAVSHRATGSYQAALFVLAGFCLLTLVVAARWRDTGSRAWSRQT